MHVLQLFATQLLAHASQVNRLPARHAFASSCTRQQPAQLGLHRDRNLAGIFWHEQFEGQGLQGIACQQGIGLAKFNVYGWLATPQHVVVHAGHVIMNQGIGMDEFNRTGCAQRRRSMSANRLAGGQHQQRAQPLSPVQNGITHGPRKGFWCLRTHPAG